MPAFRFFSVLAETGISAGLCSSAGDSLRIYRENSVPLGNACGENELVCFFAVAVFSLFYFCLYEETDNGSRRFLKYGALALFPVMVVQALGIYIRFEAYGLTAARYASMICSGFGLAVIAFAFSGEPPVRFFFGGDYWRPVQHDTAESH